MMDHFAKTEGDHRDQRHRKDGIEGQQGVDIDHKKDRQHTQNDRINKEDQPHGDRHPNRLDIIRGMGHEISHFCSSKVRRGKSLKMNEKAVPESFFHSTGRSHEKVAPNVSTASDA
jgi:hypothetical protein